MAKREKYTFKQWCIDNNKQDLLDRWDYDKTGFSPEDVTYASNKPVFFKCPNGIHDSEKKSLPRVTCKSDQNTFVCKECQKGRSTRFADLSGKRFGKITVIMPDDERNASRIPTNNQFYWKCVCDCGKEFTTYGSALKDGRQVTCGNRTIHNTKENNGRWKGGITSTLISERTSKEYDEWRDEVYAKDWYTCQCCGKSKGIEKNAHHINSFAEYDDLRFDPMNGILLCAECHHIKYDGSFHNIYGTKNNTPEQLEEYINKKRKQLGIDIPFKIDEYISGKKLKPDDISKYITVNKDNNLCSFHVSLSLLEGMCAEEEKEEV